MEMGHLGILRVAPESQRQSAQLRRSREVALRTFFTSKIRNSATLKKKPFRVVSSFLSDSFCMWLVLCPNGASRSISVDLDQISISRNLPPSGAVLAGAHRPFLQKSMCRGPKKMHAPRFPESQSQGTLRWRFLRSKTFLLR